MTDENQKESVRVEKANTYLSESYNLGGQLEWFDQKATTNKTWHMRLGILIIICGALTSLVQIWAPSPPDGVHWSTQLTAFFGVIVIIAKGIDSIWKFDENWSNYRQAAEGIKRERRFYVNNGGVYATCTDENARFELFIQNVEEVLAAEGQSFWKHKTKS